MYANSQTMKDKTIAAILALFLGGLGIHKFYLGRNLSGVLYLVFCWSFIPTILGVIDGIALLLKSNDSFDKKYNQLEFQRQGMYNELQRRDRVGKVDVADELIKLNDLKEKGIITEDDFEYRKNMLLDS